MKAKLADFLGRERTLGPAPWFLISGPQVKRGPDGEVLAEHSDAYWVRDHQHFHELVFNEPARVWYESSGGKCAVGPFERIIACDGVLYGDGGCVARLLPDEKRWFFPDAAAVTHEVLIEPVEV